LDIFVPFLVTEKFGLPEKMNCAGSFHIQAKKLAAFAKF